MSHIKLSWRNIIIAATLPAVMEVIWQLYNTYVPVFLQAGNPAFAEAGAKTVGFGLGPALTGFILVFDNIAGLFISPLVGAWSDSLRTKWGRRMPFVIIGVPIAVIAFIIIPLIPMGIKPELNGQTGQLTGLLIPFILSLVVVLIAFAIVRPIADVLMFDITPSEHRTTANGIAGAIAGFLVVVTALGGAALYALFVGALSLRTSGVYFIMVTLAFAQMAYFVFHDTKLGGGTDGIYLNIRPVLGAFDSGQKLHLYYLVLVALALTYGLLALLRQSRFGHALAGIRVNEQRMRAAGFATYAYKLAAFVLACKSCRY